jgi:hypothetical protein
LATGVSRMSQRARGKNEKSGHCPLFPYRLIPKD